MSQRSIQLILCVLLSGPAWGGAFYVDCTNGDAANPGTAELPWRSLKEALAPGRLKAGDTLYLCSGDYGAITITGQNEDFITVQARDGHQVRASSIRIRNARFWRIGNITIGAEFADPYKRQTLVEIARGASDIAIEGCTIYSVKDVDDWTAQDWVARSCFGIVASGTRIRIDRNHLRNISHGISVSGSHNVVADNVIENFSGDGIRALGDDCIYRRNVIKNCYKVDGNHDDGIQSWSTGPGGVGTGVVRNVVIDGNLIINTTDPAQKHRGTLQGIGCFDGMFENWLIVNNIIVVDHFHGISLYGAKNCRIINNTVVDNRASRPGPPWIMITKHKNGTRSSDNVIRNNLTERPISSAGIEQVDHNVVITDVEMFFADYGGFDFRLRPSCAAIDAGRAEGITETDFLGNPRVSGRTVDAGAVEYKQ